MDTETLLFFQGHMGALPLYEKLLAAIQQAEPSLRTKVQKSQISFYNRHMFACISFARVRKKKDTPPDALVLTLGLGHRLDSSRVDVATEPYPGRWTHHLLLSKPEEIDAELLAWIGEAADFSNCK